MATAKYTLRRRGSANSKGSDGRSRSYLFMDGWVCDVCKVAEFEDFEEAQRHEESCCGFNSDPNGDDKAKSNEHSKVSAGIKKTHPFFTLSTTSAVKKANALKTRPSSAPVTCEPNVRRITRSSSKENSTTAANIAPIFISKSTSRSADRKQREQLKIMKQDETLSKNIQMVEQRTAAFMAKRKLEQKQDALRRAATKRLRIAEENSESDSHREMAFSEQVQPWLHKNAAPLFPVPSHFIPSSSNSNTASYDGACSSVTKNISWKPKLKHRSQSKFTSRSGSQSLLCTAPEGCCIYDTTHKKTSLLHDAFQSAFSQIFTSCQDQSPSIPREDLNQLLELTPENVCGEVNKDACKELLGYLKEWQQYYSMIKRRKAVKTKPQTFSKQQCKKSKYVDDFDTDDSFGEDDEGISHVLLLLGPTGCGKTQLVHACASSLKNCHVLEINTSIPRGGTSLRRIMEEATQSQSLFLSSSGNDESTHDINSSSCCMPVLLLDEVDILFEDDGDSGFWPAFKQLCKKAKVPIILTATNMPCSLLSLNNSINNSEMNNCASYFRFQKVYLERPSAEECTEYLMLKLYDMIQYKPSKKQIEEKLIRKALSTVSQLLNCDIRRCLLEMLTEYNSFQKGNNMRPHRHCHATVVSGKAFTKIRYHIPCILDVQPKEVSSTRSTIIKIVGSDFLHLQQQNTSNNFVKEQISDQSLMIGGKCCPFVILRDDLIYALCPPCQLPDGVDEFGAFKNSLENCLSCSCPVIAFELIPSIHGQFISMQKSEHDNETASFLSEQPCITNLRYIFPDMGDRLDKMKKARQDIVFLRKNKMMHDDHLKTTLKEKKNVPSEYIEHEAASVLHDQEIKSYGNTEKEVSPLKGSKSETFYDVSNSADEDQVESSLESSEKHINTSMSANMSHTPSLEVAAPKKLNGVLPRKISLSDPSLPSFQETEWKSQRKMLLKAAAEDGLESPEGLVRVGVAIAKDFRSPGSPFSIEELCCLEELSHRCELASVAELIDEYNSAIVPDLAGSVPGFGFDLIGANNGSGQLTLGRNCKPPDFDRLYSNSWADRAFFHGCSESYFRRPTTTYERRLLSEASYRRSNTPPSKVGKATDNQRVSNLDEGDAFLPSNRNNEDLFLPLNETGPLAYFPDLARSLCLWTVEGCSTPIDSSVLEALLHFKRLRRSKELVSKELKSLFPDEALMSCYLSGLSCLDLFLYQDSPPCKGPVGYIDRRMTLDLFPLLRKIATFEELKQSEPDGQLDVAGDEYKGRTTRARKKNGSTHYFSLCASSIEENDAKRLGANLVKLGLK